MCKNVYCVPPPLFVAFQNYIVALIVIIRWMKLFVSFCSFFLAAGKVEEVKILEKKIKHIEQQVEAPPEAVELKPVPGLKFVKHLQDVKLPVRALKLLFVLYDDNVELPLLFLR